MLLELLGHSEMEAFDPLFNFNYKFSNVTKSPHLLRDWCLRNLILVLF